MDYIIIFVTLVLSAFFSGMEIAFVSANKLRIELDKKQDSLAVRLVSIYSKNQGLYIATMLIGNNIALVIYGIKMALVLTPYIRIFTHSELGILAIQTILSTLIILITAEFLPKTIFKNNANFLLKFLAWAVYPFYLFFYPLSWLTIQFSNFFMHRILKLKTDGSERKVVFGKVDLTHLLDENERDTAETIKPEKEIEIFKNALSFYDVKLRECMIPRPEIIAVELQESVEALQKKFIETGFSKILIYQDHIDNIVGYVHSKQLFNSPKSISSVLNSLLHVPESMPANKLLSKLMKQNQTIALVLDEFGGTAGMVTIEDLIEEIFGEIEDEHDETKHEEEVISDHEFIFSGRLEIDYLNKKYNLEIPRSIDYETIAGFFFSESGSIPEKNEKLEIGDYTLVAEKVSRKQIEVIRLIIK